MTAFDIKFQELLDAANLVQHLRETNAASAQRIEAHTALMHARVDAGKARHSLV